MEIPRKIGRETGRIDGDTAPLPVLTGAKNVSAERPHLQSHVFRMRYVARDVGFLFFAVIAAITATVALNYLAPSIAALWTSQYFDPSTAVLCLVMTGGYLTAASWGRQPFRSRGLRMVLDTLFLGGTLSLLAYWVLATSQVTYAIKTAGVLFGYNLACGVLGTALSFALARHKAIPPIAGARIGVGNAS